MILTGDDDESRSALHEPLHTLYYFPYSLYSIVVRFAFELGYSSSPQTSPRVKLHLVDLQRNENLTESYLRVTPKGQVPALRVVSATGSPEHLIESREILDWLCRAQPGMLPDEHRDDIESLLSAFYNFHAKPLAIRPDESRHGIFNKAAAMLERNDLSEGHRRCLEIKSVFHDTLHANTLDQENIEQVELQAQAFIQGVSDLIKRQQRDGADGGKFVFGNVPTVLDAVAATLLARLIDVNREDLFKDTLVKDYVLGVMDTEEWRRTTEGRPTVYDASLAQVPVHEPF